MICLCCTGYLPVFEALLKPPNICASQIHEVCDYDLFILTINNQFRDRDRKGRGGIIDKHRLTVYLNLVLYANFLWQYSGTSYISEFNLFTFRNYLLIPP